jgi:DnaJ family protein B protein 12
MREILTEYRLCLSTSGDQQVRINSNQFFVGQPPIATFTTVFFSKAETQTHLYSFTLTIMAMNKDEAERCIEIALQKRTQGDIAGALRFVRKSINLFPTSRAEELLKVLESAQGENTGTSTSAKTTPSDAGLRHRTDSSGTRPANDSSNYREEHVRAVQRVLSCSKTDYYAILSVDKNATEAHIKKAYRKLALQLHPDKNNAPGADEAFKLVSKAFTVLSDEEKRAQYDRYGADPEIRGSTSTSHYYHGGQGMHFETEITPEELFNMFFGGDMGGPFGGAAFTGPGVRIHRFGGQPRRTARPQPAEREKPVFGFLIQLLPLLLLLLLTLLSSFFSGPSEPGYAFSPSYRYPEVQYTEDYNVPYYVNPRDFNNYISGSRYRQQRFDKQVEAEYVRYMQRRCKKERDMRLNAIHRAKGWFGVGKDEDALRRAEQMPTPSCDELNRFQ